MKSMFASIWQWYRLKPLWMKVACSAVLVLLAVLWILSLVSRRGTGTTVSKVDALHARQVDEQLIALEDRAQSIAQEIAEKRRAVVEIADDEKELDDTIRLHTVEMQHATSMRELDEIQKRLGI